MIRITLAIMGIALSANAADHFVYPLPPDADVSILNDQVYKTVADKKLHFDLYRSAHQRSAVPVVVFMNGVGSGDVRHWEQYKGWGRLVTVIGMAGVVYDSHSGAVKEDTVELMTYLKQHGAELGVDASNIILWACSSNVSAGLPLAMDPAQSQMKVGVFYYGVSDEVPIRPDLPVLMVRAGLDGIGLNRGIDQFVTRASAANSPLTFINAPAAHHAFDVRDDNDRSRDIIDRTLYFMRTQIQPGAQREIQSGVTEAAAASAVYRGDAAAAMKAYEGLAATRPNDTEIRRNFGNALLAAGQYRRAIAEFERALELGNMNVGWISYSAATASIKLEDADGALKWIEKLKDIPPMWRQLSSDPNFVSLRDNPRFRTIAQMN
jgi:hypothetical protein